MAVIIPILSQWNPKGLDKAIADIQNAGSGFDKFSVGVEKASRVASVALLGLAGTGVIFAKAAADDAQAATVLATTLKNTTQATDTQIASVEKFITAQGRLLGVTDDELRPALGKLVTATGDITKAQELASLAMDISTARGVDLESVSQTLAKAYGGNFTALKKLIPGLDDAALKSKDWTVIQAELNKVVGGAAADAANTTAGQYKIFTTSLQETKEAIGAGLLPIFNQLIPVLSSVAAYIQDNSGLVLTLAGVIAGLAVVVISVNAVLKTFAAFTQLATAAQWLFNVALSANPIGLVVLGIAALIAGLVLAYNKSEIFRNAVNVLFENLKVYVSFLINTFVVAWDAVIAVINKAKDAWKSFLDFGTSFIDAGKAIVDGLKQGIMNSWDSFKAWFINLMGSPIQWAKQILRIASPSKVFAGIGENVVAGYIQGIEGMSNALQGTMSGMAMDSTVAFTGGISGPSSSGSSGNVYNINVNAGMGTNGAQVGKEIVDAIKRFEKASGPVFASA
jgi:hypothetical protein